jgi:hypothetical protein
MPWTRTVQHSVGAVVAGGLALSLSGCIIDKDSYAGVHNLTDQRIVVTGTVEGVEEPIRRRAEPRQMTPLFSGGEQCRQVSLEFAFPQQAEPFEQYVGGLCNEQKLEVAVGEVVVRD